MSPLMVRRGGLWLPGSGGTPVQGNALALTLVATSYTSLVATWAADAAAVSYDVAVDGGAWSSVADTTTTITGLTSGATVDVAVRAVYLGGGTGTVSTKTVTLPSPASAFPDQYSTGLPAGMTEADLTPYTGPATITTPTTLDGYLITTPLVIAASAGLVTILNSISRVEAYWNVLNADGAQLVVRDTELDGLGNASSDSAVSGYNMTLQRVNAHGTGDGIKAGSSTLIEDSYVHDLALVEGGHNDGIQSLGANGLTIRHNTVVLVGNANSAIILSTGSADEMRNILVDTNLLGGGAYTVFGGYEAGVDNLSKISNIAYTNNQITTAVYPNGGAYGAFTSVSPPVELSGNVWADGPNAGLPAA